MTVFKSGCTVSVGPNVVFGGHVVIEPGAKVMTDQGPVPAPVAVSPSQAAGGCGQTSEGGGVIFAKSASSPCKQAGVRHPVKVLETDTESPDSMAVSDNGVVVVKKKKMVVYDSDHKKQYQKEIPDLPYARVAFDPHSTTVVAISVLCIARLDMELNVVVKTTKNESPDLKPLSTPYDIAIGSQGRLYIAGCKMCHIVNADFSYYKTFAEGCQAFGIATSNTGNVYVPIQQENTVRVFCPDGKQLFQFGGPGRAPLPHMALLVPMSIALDRHDNVYVGIGLNSVNKFDAEGRFVEPFLMQGAIDNLAQLLCTDPSGETLYVGIHDEKKVTIYKL